MPSSPLARIWVRARSDLRAFERFGFGLVTWVIAVLKRDTRPKNWHRQIIARLTRENIRKDHKENIFTQRDLHRIRGYSR